MLHVKYVTVISCLVGRRRKTMTLVVHDSKTDRFNVKKLFLPGKTVIHEEILLTVY